MQGALLLGSSTGTQFSLSSSSFSLGLDIRPQTAHLTFHTKRGGKNKGGKFLFLLLSFRFQDVVFPVIALILSLSSSSFLLPLLAFPTYTLQFSPAADFYYFTSGEKERGGESGARGKEEEEAAEKIREKEKEEGKGKAVKASKRNIGNGQLGPSTFTGR